MFAADFLLGHFILFLLFLFCLIPYIDRVHSLMLFWLRPSKQIRPQILSIKKSKQRRRIVILYSALFVLIFLVMIAAIAVPCILQPQVSLAKFSAIDVWIRNLYNICIPFFLFLHLCLIRPLFPCEINNCIISAKSMMNFYCFRIQFPYTSFLPWLKYFFISPFFLFFWRNK